MRSPTPWARRATQHLPAGYLDDPALLADGLADRLETLADALRRRRPGERRRRARSDASSTGRTLWQRGGLRDRTAARDLTATTPLRRRPGHPCVLRRDGDRLRVLLGDRELVMPGHLEAALSVVREAGSLTPADLDLDEQSRLVLCRRLVREGLLEVVT